MRPPFRVSVPPAARARRRRIRKGTASAGVVQDSVWKDDAVARLERLRALVTGGTSGIGTAIVERLSAEGAAVVFTGRNPERGAEVAARTGAGFVAADVRDAASVEVSVAAAAARLEGLDALVANAGVLRSEENTSEL